MYLGHDRGKVRVLVVGEWSKNERREEERGKEEGKDRTKKMEK